MSRKYGTFFSTSYIYCQVAIWKEVYGMLNWEDPAVDLDDLIFDEDAGGPSQR